MSDCMMETDWKGCCCACEHQYKVYKHPSNENEYAKGSVLEIMGWICLIRGDKGGTFMDREHSMCEEYTPKDME